MKSTAALLLFCSLAIGGTALLRAQQTVSPEVQALYQHARTAQAADDNAGAVADYLKILRLDPKLGAAYNNLGRLYYNMGRYTDAIPVLVHGLRVDPSMHPAEIILGASYYQTGSFDKAILSLEAALNAMPDDRFAGITLVHALVAQNNLDEAVQQLRHLIGNDPKDQEAWYLLGKLQLQLSQQAFERVHAIDPDSPLAHELSGEIMESMKNTPGAIAEYKKALEVAPTDAGAMEHLANAYWSGGEWTEARDSFAAILQHDPNNCLAHWKLANSLDELNTSPADALKQVDAALATCPSLAQARVERAKILLRLGRPADSLPELLTAEKSVPDEPSIQILLAKAYKALGDSAHAAEADAKFKQLLQAEHSNEENHAADVIRANQ
ncbi:MULTISPECIES: tetratricopeptide repeat protein [Acidobacteriaceae]|uniref:tetratricopeptide repeat protein n=1 Tax=Acidobacteriaceae TaxID=204434 RepID=UPI00131BD7EB|nr:MULTISPECIES: tetratricopeptide repeat protein [Acidobacteriaceae]MDW5266620.1 tetratricopeptide repeat protein [Edaphobacter sp.]